MGRAPGWNATYKRGWPGAPATSAAQRPFPLHEVRRASAAAAATPVSVSRSSSVAEGAREATDGLEDGALETDAFGHPRLGGIAATLEKEMEARTGFETRMTILGHVQRAGTPTAYRPRARRHPFRRRRRSTPWPPATSASSGPELHAADTVETPQGGAGRAEVLLDPELYETAEVFFG